MTTVTQIILLFLLASLVAVIFGKIHVPYTVDLVLVSLGIGALQLINVPVLTQEIMFLIFSRPGLRGGLSYRLWRFVAVDT